MQEIKNIYRASRLKAALKKPMYSNRERAAADLFVSTEALQDYETGQTLPPCDVVQRMVEAYEDIDLRRRHIRSCCPLLPDYGGEEPGDLTRAALACIAEAADAYRWALQFASLARDGKITPEELGDAVRIRCAAITCRKAMTETVAALDAALLELRGKTK